MEFNTDIFAQFDKKWALLTAGNMSSYNTMTISWGQMGTLWGKPVITSYVRTSRYTHEFLDSGEYFTVCFFPEDYKKTLAVLGSKSGRDIDKLHVEGLTAKSCGETVAFEEALVTLVCKKLFRQRLDPSNIEDSETAIKAFYEKDAEHDMYIGEVIDVLTKST